MAAYITVSISAKLQCNFLTPYFSAFPITQTTPHGYFWWDSELEKRNKGEKGGRVFMEQPTFPSSSSIHPAPWLISNQIAGPAVLLA